MAVGSVSAQAQTVEYLHTDALGTLVAVTNTAGVVIERSEYEPYGKLLNRPLADGPGFTGHVQDAATGLTYMQQRYFDPGIGRFLSVDPVTANSNTGANFNRYWYANNNPYKFVDPDGRCARELGSMICMKARKFEAKDVDLVHTERTAAPNGGSSEAYRKIEPGTVEHQDELQKLPEDSRGKVAGRVNELGKKLESRGDGAQVRTFNEMKVGIEVNPSRAHGASYSAKGIYGTGMIINPQIFLSMNDFRQNNRIAHEFRHLQLDNYLIPKDNYSPYSSPSEKDARDYAKELFGEAP
ncbi:RHS repeat domain-containing protein [Pseudoxanthomonas sacheonensis]|uniref:RHS repeat-associated protein n=1 Tax=Pseudoxanthomonas sacheonensis TaxID=443615 RepID=A0ABU1RNU0_9GAMM|nr:RHS repeat-associated core domain-containing protein [Pseudoxanthomonas sacheonensis]MDR6840430.1 RHS repeat-associated protein [Pseudoxanthomonas sacheonensis]